MVEEAGCSKFAKGKVRAEQGQERGPTGPPVVGKAAVERLLFSRNLPEARSDRITASEFAGADRVSKETMRANLEVCVPSSV